MTSRILAGRFLAFAVLLFLATMAAAQTSQTTTEVKKGDAVITTSELKGEVEYVEGNTLVVTMSSGEARTFNVPESRKFLIDGKELSVHELQPGTKLTATVTTTTTPVTVRTATIKSGRVWYVMGKSVILTLPSGENKQFIVQDDTRFIVNGNPATVHDLKKGMVVYAEKVVEEPSTEITTNTTVVGQAPPPAAEPGPAVAAAPPRETPPAEAQAPPSEPPPAVAKEERPSEHPSTIPGDPPTPPKTTSRTTRIAVLCGLLVAGAIAIWMLVGRKSGGARS